MDMKNIDPHGPKYYFEKYKIGFSQDDQKMRSAAVLGIVTEFRKDLDILCTGGTDKFTPMYVKQAIDWLDLKWTNTVHLFHQHNLAKELPLTGWRDSLLNSVPDLKKSYYGIP